MAPDLSISLGMSPKEYTAPTLSEIEAIALDTVAQLPEPFRPHAQAIVLHVVDFAPDEMLANLDIHDPFQLTGLYDGIPLTEKSVSDQPLQPDAIWLFRRAILDEWAARGNVTLKDLVVHVMLHELAHHFGWSDDDTASIDQWWT